MSIATKFEFHVDTVDGRDHAADEDAAGTGDERPEGEPVGSDGLKVFEAEKQGEGNQGQND